ncbi:phenylalanyl-tRNA synthetase beta subunit [Pediococcus acidilactici NGRI 0510Q]|nr:phenylalanyl-tRNA synthetase beta subunit [Pediococcus acidilactici NGRI 0510Q]
MITEFGKGQAYPDEVVGAATTKEPVKVAITLAKINRVLGTTLTISEVEAIFARLGFDVTTDENAETFEVTVPVRRWDIHLQADLLEEIARIYGYDNLPVTLPTGAPTVGQLTEKQKIMRNSRQILEGLGLTQAMSYGLTTVARVKTS